MLHKINMKRKEFVGLIDHAIDKSYLKSDETLDPTVTTKLEAVAQNTHHVAFGIWYASNNISCGCPAVEAGLADKYGHNKSPAIGHFVEEFDDLVYLNLVDRDLTKSYGIITIKED